MRLTAGTILREKYQIIRRIDDGEAGEVFEARHLDLAGRYAIKVLSEGGIKNALLLDELRRVALATSQLTHPGIVRVYDLDQAPDGSPFMVMEYLHGQNLGRVIRESGRMALVDVVALVEAIASPLAEAHGRGIVHGDLTPENVFVLDAAADPHARVKVLDFGVAKIRAQAGGIVRSGATTGAPGYSAPERARGLAWQVDERTDVFGLGAITRALISGPATVVRTTTSPGRRGPVAEAEPLAALPAVVTVIERATREHPDDRFRSVTAFAEALHAAVAASRTRASGVRSTRLGATPPTPLSTLHPPSARARRIGSTQKTVTARGSLRNTVAAAVGCGVAILVGTVIFTKPPLAPQPSPPAAPSVAVVRPKPAAPAPLPAPARLPLPAPARLPLPATRPLAATDGAGPAPAGRDAPEGGHHHHHSSHGEMTEADRHEMEQSYQKATRAFDVSNYDEAIDAYKKTYELGGAAPMLYNIAQALRLSNQPAEAITYYRRYLDRAPGAANEAEVRARIAELVGAPPSATAATTTTVVPAATRPSLDCHWSDHVEAGKPLDVSCAARDPQTVVAKVVLRYRESGAGPFTDVELAKGVRGSYEGIVPGSAVSTKGLELYVEGRRASGETAVQSGSASHPRGIVVARP